MTVLASEGVWQKLQSYILCVFVPPPCLCGFLKNCLKIRTLFSNTHNMNRKQFLSRTTGAGLIMAAPFSFLPASHVHSDDPIDPKLVYEFVRLAYSEYDTVVAMHKEHPTLLNCAWDSDKWRLRNSAGRMPVILETNKSLHTYWNKGLKPISLPRVCLDIYT